MLRHMKFRRAVGIAGAILWSAPVFAKEDFVIRGDQSHSLMPEIQLKAKPRAEWFAEEPEKSAQQQLREILLDVELFTLPPEMQPTVVNEKADSSEIQKTGGDAP